MPVERRLKAEVDAYIRALGIVTGCISRQPLSPIPKRYDTDRPHVVTFGPSSQPVSLGDAEFGGRSGLLFDVWHQYGIVQEVLPGQRRPWRPMTTAYEYRLLDRFEQELLVFHWHPGPAFAGPDHPHLHVSASLTARVSATEQRRIDLDKRHLPTKWLSRAAVVRMLIEEFGVRPLHADWHQRLDRANAASRLWQRSFDARA